MGDELCRLLDQIHDRICAIELQHAVLTRLIDIISKYRSATRPCRSLAELFAQPMAEEEIVAENERNIVPGNECAPQDEGMSEPNRLLLNDIVEPDPPRRSIGQQMSIECEMLGRRNDQNLADAGKH